MAALRRLPTARIVRRAYAALIVAEVAQAYEYVGITPDLLTTTRRESRPRGVVREFLLEARAVLCRHLRSEAGLSWVELSDVLGVRARGGSGSTARHYVADTHLEPEALEILDALPAWDPQAWTVTPCPRCTTIPRPPDPCEVCHGLRGVAERTK